MNWSSLYMRFRQWKLDSFQTRYPDRQDEYYIKARMIYVITDQVAKDILCVNSQQQKEEYIQLFIEEILHFSFDL